ncbi:hypothetical protein H6P81_002843 [Aristolochia fimbriata]|uniref:Uncharacterized protein n=1 Tax=Aristolochia fimbriata TaxID=158543 RepID=A0AAV7FDS4_ARIFI|nr:hypothetical protein H6P81_002843 [Aristolochia fimbriata]
MVDATTGYDVLAFMDASSDYNQIRMDPKDEELTALRTPKGIFWYKVMRFSLKEAGATYQRVMQHIFDDFLHKRVECYVDDLVVKTKERADHLLDLKAVLMKKNVPFEWDDACRNAFNSIKAYLTKPPMLVVSIIGKPLLLYIAAQENLVGVFLAQSEENNKEWLLYYLSRTLVGAKVNYMSIEKACLALIFAIQKLRHYLLAHSTNLTSRANLLKYIMSWPILSGRLAKWSLLLSEFEKNFVPQRAIKGHALANFLTDHPVPAEWELTEEFPDKEIFVVEIFQSWKCTLIGPPGEMEPV